MFLRKKRRPSLNEIEAVFRKELEPEFAALEKQRQGIYWTGGIIAAVTLAVASLLYRSGTVSKNLDAFEVVFMVGLAVGAFATSAKVRDFKKRFKERVMAPVAKRFFPELQYVPESHVSKDSYDESDLFRKELSTYVGNDLFRGKLGDVDFYFSELLCQYTTGSGKNKQTNTAFRGFFFVGEFHRDIFFRTKIVPDTVENLLGVVGRGLQRFFSSKQEQLVDLENAEFEQLFKVTGNDQVEARFILTPKFMEKLVDFRKKVGNNVHLSFCNGRMFLAVETHHDYFEPSLAGEVLSRKDLMKFIDMLILLMGVADEFLHQPRVSAVPNPPKMPPLPSIAGKGFIQTLKKRGA